MSDLPTVVAAIDDDDAASAVLALARLIAAPQRGGRWYAAHAAVAPAPAIEAMLFPWACLGDDRDAIHAELLEAAGEAIRRRCGAELPQGTDTLRLAWGAPATALRTITDALGPDWVVAGSGSIDTRVSGRLGPVPDALARVASRPLVLARPERDPERLATIVVALDLTPHSVGVLADALLLAHWLDATVVPVHVSPTADDRDHAAVVGDQAARQKARKDTRALLTRVLETLELPFAAESERAERLQKAELRQGDPGPELVAAAEACDADLIMIGRSHPAHGTQARLGRVAEYVARRAHCHVALVAGGASAGS